MLDFDSVPCSSTHIASSYAFGKICFWSVEGRHRAVVIVFCQRSGLLFKLLDARRHYSGEGVGLTAKVLERDFNLVRTNWSFPERCEPILQMPRGPVVVGFPPERSPQPRGVDLGEVFQMGQRESGISLAW